MKKSFIDRHPNATSVVGVIVWFIAIALMALFTGCSSGKPNIVEIVKTDTLHVYHTDTMKVVHNDTIYSVKVQTVHDSIIKTTIITKVVNEEGEVVHSEKETNNEVFHNSDTNSQLIQHTVDSILQAKMDSISHASCVEEPVIYEVEKSTPWYKRIWQNIKDNFAAIGFTFIILSFFVIAKYILAWIKKKQM